MCLHVHIHICMYTYVNVWLHSFLQGDSVILEKKQQHQNTQEIHFMEVGSHELLQVANMMFWEVHADKKKCLRTVTTPKNNIRI